MQDQDMVFGGWMPLLRITVVGVISYIFLVLMLRAAGKRTLSRMNAYDMVVTMALGAAIGRAMLTKDQTIVQTCFAVFLLIAFQYILSWASVRWEWFCKLIVPSPAVLYHQGDFVRPVLRKERVSEDEVMAAVHEKGIAQIEEVDAVILGSNGELSVLLKPGKTSAAQAPLQSKRQGKV